MLARTLGILLACALAPTARADGFLPPPERPAPRVGLLIGMEKQSRTYFEDDDYGISLRVDGETRPLAGDSHHTLSALGVVSGSLFREKHAGQPSWRTELRLIPGVRWTITDDLSRPRNQLFVDAGLGGSWSDHTPDGAFSSGRWDRPALRVVGRVAAGLAWNASPRSRWMVDYAWLPYFGTGHGSELVFSVGYCLALR